jgi:hypothetical protein
MRGYTDQSTIENYMLKSIDTTFQIQLESWIEAVEKMIEQITGRVFIADTEASERIYNGQGDVRQKFDEFVIDSEENPGIIIKLGEDEPRVTIEQGDYRIYPTNQENKSIIELKSASFERGYQNVRITAKWGSYREVPADIKLAATILVAGIINNSSPDKGMVRSESLGAYTISYANEKGWADYTNAMSIILSHKRFSF